MKVILAQTDTTVGFLSQSSERLEAAKGSREGKYFLKVFADFRRIRETLRVPLIHRRRVRYARKTTFIVQSLAFRYVDDPDHARLIAPYGWLYSTSANPSGGTYDPDYCRGRADWIVEDARGLRECPSSSIVRLGRTRLRRLR